MRLRSKTVGRRHVCLLPAASFYRFLGRFLGRESQFGLQLPGFGLHLVQRHGWRFFLLGHHLDQNFGQDGCVRPLQQFHRLVQRLPGESGHFQLPAFLIQTLHDLRTPIYLVIPRFEKGPAGPGQSVPGWPPDRVPACPLPFR